MASGEEFAKEIDFLISTSYVVSSLSKAYRVNSSCFLKLFIRRHVVEKYVWRLKLVIKKQRYKQTAKVIYYYLSTLIWLFFEHYWLRLHSCC